MDHSDGPIPLRDAIRNLTPNEKWTALLELVGGKGDDAMSALSGRPAGRLLLDVEIAARSFYADPERGRVRAFERLRGDIISCFNIQRRSGGLVLKGYTAAWPTWRAPISPGLPLEYDFISSTARSGDLQFHDVTVHAKKANASAKAATASRSRVPDPDLEKFCKTYIANAARVPSMEALEVAAKGHFAGKHIGRARLRALHAALIPAISRRPGPRK